MAGVFITFADGSEMRFDATMTQKHGRSAQVTKHPVEQGADISDNIRPEPRELKLSAIVSAFPIVEAQATPEANRVGKALDALEKAFAAAEPVTVATNTETYENMAIRRLDYPKDAKIGDDLYVEVDLVEIITVETQSTKVPGSASKAAISKPARAGAAPPATKGQQPKAPASSAQAAASSNVAKAAAPKSLLRSALSFVGL